MTAETEIGATVADARRLARRATNVFVHFQTGPKDWQTECLMLKRAAFMCAVRYKKDTDPMPCKLYNGSGLAGELWLSIGGRGEQ